MAVEGFTHPQAAEILGVTDQDFAGLIDEASAEISRQVATEIMIIEDEPLIAMDIEQLVESLDRKVVCIARTHKEAVSLFTKTWPSMILADIQLADGSRASTRSMTFSTPTRCRSPSLPPSPNAC